MDIQDILIQSVKHWDGGYVMCGLLGHGDLCLKRSKRMQWPTFYYKNEEVVVVASERPVIQTALIVNQKIYMK